MLRLADPAAMYEVQVPVTLPGGEVQEYTATFQVPSNSELADLPTDAEIVRRHLVRFSGIRDADDEPLDGRDEAVKAQLADIPYFARATARAFVEWAAGVEEKNSAASPAH